MKKPSFILILLLCASVAPAGTAPRKPRITSLFYYVNTPTSPEILRANAHRISIIAPQTFSMDAEGFIMGEVPPVVKEVARENHIAIMPLVTNRGFKPETMHAVLDSPALQQRVIRYLLYYCKRDNAIGFQFDYENIHYLYRDKFTAFTERVARAFHRRGLLLTLAVVGRSTGERNPDRPGGWDYWSGVYDYKKLARVADFISVMAYAEHSGANPGPVASIPWMEGIAEYTLSQMPRTKVSWGIPVYPIHWIRPAGEEKWRTVRGAMFSGLKPLFDRQDAVNKWDETLSSGSLEYTDNGDSHVVWYEDARSVRAKLELIHRHRFLGFSAWRLGQEDPETWKLLDTEFPVKRATTKTQRTQSPRR